MVISQGRIVERGSVDDVMVRPAHPYTQLLLSSLPVPEPAERWKERLEVTEQTAERASASRERCLFAERCRFVMNQCWEQRPGMRPVRDGQAATCFLYQPSADDGALGRGVDRSVESRG